MKKKAKYLWAACFSLLLITGFFTPGKAQQANIGVVWELPSDTDSARTEMEVFKNLGVTHLEVNAPVNKDHKALLRDSSFTFLIRSNFKFLTASTLQERKNTLRSTISELTNEYSSYSRVAGFGVVSQSQTLHPEFIPALSSILSSINRPFDRPFYFVQNQHWYRLTSPDIVFGTAFEDHQYQKADLMDFSKFMSEIDAKTIAFINSDWLIKSLNDYPEIQEAFHEYKLSGKWQLPHPDVDKNGLKANWMVLILILLWASLTLQIRYLPYVSGAIFRYFFAHRFFADDVLGYRERAVTAAILQLITHAIFAGLLCFICSHLLFSDIGLEALYHHFQWLAITGENYYSFFLLGFISVLVLEVLAILWLHLPAKNLSHISQTLNLYSGIFYIDYLIVTVMVTLFTAGTGDLFTLGLAVVFILIWLLSFYITAFDIGQNNRENKALYLLLTTGIHALLLIVIVVTIVLFTDVVSVLQLAASLQ